MDFPMDMEWPTKIHNPYGFKILMDYGFYGFKIHIDYGFFMDLKSIWIMDFHGFKIHMNYGFFMEWI